MLKKLTILLVILLGSGFTSTSNSETKEVRFATHYKRNISFVVPVVAALEKGFWKEQGLEVKWFPFDAAGSMIRAVAGGEIDMGTHGMDSVVIAASRGVPEVIVADPKMRTDFYFWVLTDSPITSAKDLRGAKIGSSRFGGTPHRLGQMVVAALGIEREVKFIALGGGMAQQAAFLARRVDAVISESFVAAPLKAKGKVRELLPVKEYVPDVPGEQVIYAHRSFLNKNPEAIKKAAKGFLKGAQFAMENQDWTIRFMKKDFALSEEEATAILPELRYGSDGKINVREIEKTLNFVVKHGLVPKEKAPRLETLYAEGLAE